MNVDVYLHEVRRYVLLALVPALLCGLVVYRYTKNVPRTYVASATLYVEQPSLSQGIPDGIDINGSQLLVPT